MGQVSTNDGTAQAATTTTTTTATDTPNGEEQAPTPAGVAAHQAATLATETTSGTTTSESVDDLPQWARDRLTRANQQAAAARVEKNNATAARDSLAKAIGEAFGIDTGQALTPEQLSEKVTQADARARNAELTLAIYRNAPANADIDLLLDSQTFTKSLDGFDPADTDTMKTHIVGFLTDNPRYVKAPQAGASTADVTGSGISNTKPATLAAALSNHYGN